MKTKIAIVIIICIIIFSIGYYMTIMPGKSAKEPIQPLTNQQEQIRDQLKTIIKKLADEIGERNIWNYEKLNQTANYIEDTFEKYGFAIEIQSYQYEGKTVKNIQATIPGKTHPDQIIVVGAHYDSVYGSPGANDNASGVAALLEIARLLQNKTFAKTIRLVAFVNEEPPFFYTKQMGSYHYVKQAKKNKDNIIAMFSLETMGFYSNQQNSQLYPLFLSWFYPNQANFIGFVGNIASHSLVRKSIKIFRENIAFPSEGIIAPSFITGVDWSDQYWFWHYGYKGIMVTDTAFYRYPHYHTSEDTAEKVDYDRLARVVEGITIVIINLANAS